MNNLLQYLAELSLALLLFYALYRLLLSQQTCFKFNRFYLLASLLLSLAIPFLELPEWPTKTTIKPNSDTTAILVQPEATWFPTETTAISPRTAGAEQIDYTVYFYYLYGTGLVVAFLLFCWQFLKLYTFIYRHTGNSYFWRNIKVIPTDGKMATFSFLRYIFYDNSQRLTPTEKELIFQHEQAHLQQKHSLDIVLVRLLHTVFWFNPLFYFYQKALENTHEYLADAQVVQRQNAETYAAFLIQQVFSRTGFSLGSSFHLNKSLTLKRIVMLNKINLRTRITRPLVAIPAVCALSLIFASNRPVELPEITPPASAKENSAASTPAAFESISYLPGANGIKIQLYQTELATGKLKADDPIKSMLTSSQEPVKEKIYEYGLKVIQPPKFPGGDPALDRYVKENLNYPAEARKAKTEGWVEARFVVDSKGKIGDVEIKKSLTKETDAEVIRLIKSMPDFVTPAIREGKPVAVRDRLLVRFGFDSSERVHMFAEQPPSFPGGETALNKFFKAKLKYPAAAVKAKTEGLVVVQFLVNSKGKLSDFIVVKGLSPELDTEALRVTESLPDFVPAQRKGQPVAFVYTLPIRFGL